MGAALPSLLMLWRYSTDAGLTVFTYLVNLTVVTVAIPYFISAIAQLAYLVSRRRRVQGWLLARDLSVAGASILFSMWVTFASGYQAVYQALVAILAGLVLYVFVKARRERLGEVPEPVDIAPDQAAPRTVRPRREPRLAVRVVVALGGNALLRRGQALTDENQRRNVATACAGPLAPLVRQRAPGRPAGAAGPPTQGADLPARRLGAETQGMIGYLVEQELGNRLPIEEPSRPCSR